MKDISIRLALGGSAAEVLKLIVGQGMKVVVIGLVVGLATAFAVTRFITSLLFGVAAADLSTFAGVSGMLLIVALIACWLPETDAPRRCSRRRCCAASESMSRSGFAGLSLIRSLCRY